MAQIEQVRSIESSPEPDNQERVRLAAEVFQKYGKDIRAMIRFTIKDPAEADDLFQSLFLSLVARPLPSDIRRVRRYLYKAILHDAITLTRREQCYRRHIKVYACHQNRPWAEDPQEVLMQAERTQTLLQMAQTLRPTEALAILCEYGQGCDRQDASQKMGVQRRSFSKYLWRGLKKLRHQILIREGHDK